MTYLDHAASTPLRREALEAMLPYFCEQYANPSGTHRAAREARQAVDEARDIVAATLGVTPGEVVFTGGGTEADNTAIFGARRPGAEPDATVVCSAAEHHAVLHPVERSGGVVVGVDATAHIDIERLADVLAGGARMVRMVSVMAVNNEVGTVTRLAEVAGVVRELAPDAVVHTDAIQAPCWLDLRELAAVADMVSLSGHKFGGPKGVGVLVERQGLQTEPLICGGGQERDRRSGTLNVPGIVGLAVALAATDDERPAEVPRIAALRDRLVDAVTTGTDGVTETVPRAAKVAGSAHVCVEGVESEALLYLLDQAGVCASAASACASGAMEPSHVLAAMGIDRDSSKGALRLSLGRTTTTADIDRAADVLVDSINRLRSLRPLIAKSS